MFRVSSGRLATSLALAVALAFPQAGRALPAALATAPTPIQAVMSSDGRHVAWRTDTGPITVVDRQAGAEVTYDLSTLRPQGVSASAVGTVFGISDDGRFLTYAVVASVATGGHTTIVRLDRTTATHLVVYDNRDGLASGPATVIGAVPRVAVSRDGQTFTWIHIASSPTLTAQVWLRQASQPAAVSIGTTCLVPGLLYPSLCMSAPALSGDGQTVLYTAGDNAPTALASYDVATGTTTHQPQVRPVSFTPATEPLATLATTLDAAFVVARSNREGDVLFDRPRGRVDTLAGSAPAYTPVAVSDDGARVLLTGVADTWASAVIDRSSALLFPMDGETRALAITADGSAVLTLTRDMNLQAFVLDVRDLDADGDGILDGWESFFGLDPTDAGDGTLDANGDGVSNLLTWQQRGHPTALASATRLFAEGAGGAFFDTSVSIFNPGADAAAVVVRFLGTNGEQASRAVQLPPQQRVDIDSCCVPTLHASEFSVQVESDRLVVAERRMSWDRTTGYGSHASTGTPSPSETWHFAEGATIAGFQTFYLLQNPGVDAASVSMAYLLSDGRVEERTHIVPAGSRYTIWVNQEGAPLDAAEFAATVTASRPVVAERAMYRPAEGRAFAAGSNAMGVTAPAMSWSFAEGATGDFFDTFILVANVAQEAGTVTAEFRTTDAQGTPITVSKSYEVAARTRLTIWIDQEDARLASGAVSTKVTADVPVVAERAMWWPGTPRTWQEAHAEFGATATATRWAIADGEMNLATGTDTFVLVDADTGGLPATARVTVYPSTGFPLAREVALGEGRNTLWMAQLFPEVSGQRFAVVVESLDRPGGAAALTVEKALYSGWFGAGAAALATPLPES